MAKQQKVVHQTGTQDRNGKRSAHIVQSETYDDNLLPDPKTIGEYQAIDPTITTWLRARAEKEQDFRHAAYNAKSEQVRKTEQGYRIINYLGMFFALLVILSGMLISYFLIIGGQQIWGSVFAGGTLFFGAALFLNKVYHDKNKENNN
ncbi:MAG: hypothetical protein LCH54_11160 [Bacteroidetes bacterium]|nr:hypothetical protein [Bacteroidota bacterium]